ESARGWTVAERADRGAGKVPGVEDRRKTRLSTPGRDGRAQLPYGMRRFNPEWAEARPRVSRRPAMKKCSTCGTSILLGGKSDGELRYCSTRCQQQGALMRPSRQLPDAEVRQQLMSLHQGLCPKCHGPGPVDL